MIGLLVAAIRLTTLLLLLAIEICQVTYRAAACGIEHHRRALRVVREAEHITKETHVGPEAPRAFTAGAARGGVPGWWEPTAGSAVDLARATRGRAA